MRFLSILLLLIFACPAVSASDPIRFGSFAETGLAGWTERSFEGNTEYALVKDGQTTVLQAKSKAAASGLVYEVEYKPSDSPVLSWRWKVEDILPKGDSRTKDGDDYAARIYVVFPHWFFPKTRSLNYIWANRLEKDSIVPNAFTGNAMMIAVESGPEHVGKWMVVQRNIVEDFRRAFGEDPPEVGAIAIMTDTDNTGGSAKAWYGDITASRK